MSESFARGIKPDRLRLIRIKEYPIDVEHLDFKFEDASGEFEYFEIKRGDMTEELGERLDIANVKMTKMTQKQDVMIEKLDNNTSILNDFKNENNIMTKHDIDAQERIANLTVEISGIKEQSHQKTIEHRCHGCRG